MCLSSPSKFVLRWNILLWIRLALLYISTIWFRKKIVQAHYQMGDRDIFILQSPYLRPTYPNCLSFLRLKVLHISVSLKIEHFKILKTNDCIKQVTIMFNLLLESHAHCIIVCEVIFKKWGNCFLEILLAFILCNFLSVTHLAKSSYYARKRRSKKRNKSTTYMEGNEDVIVIKNFEL